MVDSVLKVWKGIIWFYTLFIVISVEVTARARTSSIAHNDGLNARKTLEAKLPTACHVVSLNMLVDTYTIIHCLYIDIYVPTVMSLRVSVHILIALRTKNAGRIRLGRSCPILKFATAVLALPWKVGISVKWLDVSFIPRFAVCVSSRLLW